MRQLRDALGEATRGAGVERRRCRAAGPFHGSSTRSARSSNMAISASPPARGTCRSRAFIARRASSSGCSACRCSRRRASASRRRAKPKKLARAHAPRLRRDRAGARRGACAERRGIGPHGHRRDAAGEELSTCQPRCSSSRRSIRGTASRSSRARTSICSSGLRFGRVRRAHRRVARSGAGGRRACRSTCSTIRWRSSCAPGHPLAKPQARDRGCTSQVFSGSHRARVRRCACTSMRCSRRRRLELPSPPLECNSLAAARAFLLESDRIMLLSAHQIHYEMQAGLLVALPHPAGKVVRPIGLTLTAQLAPDEHPTKVAGRY